MELRLEGSEELGYDPLGTPPKGEICLRGPMVFSGYYKDPEKTKEAFGARPRFNHPCVLYAHVGEPARGSQRQAECLFRFAWRLMRDHVC